MQLKLSRINAKRILSCHRSFYNRPTELIYEINLPLVTTPSKIILDVSEKYV